MLRSIGTLSQAYDVLAVSSSATCASTTASSSPTGETTSTASRTSGTRPSATCAVTMAIPRAHFPLDLKECEWRFNYRPAKPLARNLKNLAQGSSIYEAHLSRDFLIHIRSFEK